MNTNLRVCTIGGGSGMPMVNRALVLAGFEDIHSIVTTFDSGGDTGRMRTDERGRLLAFSDYWRALMSLWPDGEQKLKWEELLRFRDGRGRNFGNLFFQFMAEKSGNLSGVDRMFSELVGGKLKGEIVPVSSKPAQLCFETTSGKNYCGENFLDELRMSRDMVKKIWVEPEVEANIEAIESLISAEVILVCPGSMYGSVIINFLVRGIREAFRKSRANKILMTNIMTVANENNGFDQDDYVKKFEDYLGYNTPFDMVLMADLRVLDRELLKTVEKLYEYENSFPVGWSRNSKYKTIFADMAVIDERNLRLRHGARKMAEVFKDLEL